jgi:exopolysaccharide production protein ExoQ
VVPKLALIICLLYVGIVFWMDYKREQPARFSLLALLWISILCSKSLGQWISGSGADSTTDTLMEGNPVNRYFFLVMILSGFILVARKSTINWRALFKVNRWLLLLFIYYAVSIAWSDFPFVSFKRFYRAIGDPLFVILVLSEEKPIEHLLRLYRKSSYLLLPLSIVFIKYFPLIGRTYHRYSGEMFINGVSTGKNGLGAMCLIFSFYLIHNLFIMQKNGQLRAHPVMACVDLLNLGMLFWLLIKANSSTSLMCFIIGIIVYFLFAIPKVKQHAKVYLFGLVVVGLCLTPVLFLGQNPMAGIVDSTGHSDTFWDRIGNWPIFIEHMNASPVFGCGFRSYWLGSRLELLWNQYWWHPTEAHNGYIETILQVGFVGLGILIMFLLKTTALVSKSITANIEHSRLFAALLVMAVFFNIMEAGFVEFYDPWFNILIVAFASSRTDWHYGCTNIEKFSISSS